MHLHKLSLINYKNFSSENFEFDTKTNCFVGHNGVGKTNILDAIYHLSFGKSYFNPITSQNIKHNEDFFVIDGFFKKNEKEEHIVSSLKKGAKKIIKRNGKAYERFSDHIGLLPLVIISPYDRDLIAEGSVTRRKFIDGVISQSDKEYLLTLIKYNKVLSQRNSLLKYFAINHIYDATNLDVYNEQLHEYGTLIFNKRQEFLNTFIPIFKEQYKAIANITEEVTISFESKLKDQTLLQLLKATVDKDRALQYTSTGIHKDDLSFKINDYPVKKFGSQGQQKSFLIALKFAQFHFIKEQSRTTPILVLDDIFDKLDEDRVAHIISLVDNESFGQIFISDTHAERTENLVKNIHQSYKIFKL